MKKRFATMLAATAVLGVTTAFAANPFSDVTPNDWAYQSVAQLAEAGVINGYPDGTFKGQNNITRFEMAQMVAKAMANQERANAEQQAVINRLAEEFSSELNNLGVRVSALEDKVGNVKVFGDGRIRYRGSESGSNNYLATTNNPNKTSVFDYRARINFQATVNENTTALVRVATSGMVEMGTGANETKEARIDRALVNHKFGDNTTLTVGRQALYIGDGLIFDDAYDAAKLQYRTKDFSLAASYGSFVAGSLVNAEKDATGKLINKSFSNSTADDNYTVTLLEAAGKLGDHATLGGYYIFANKGFDNDIYGGYVNLNFDKVWIGGEYATFSDDVNGSSKNDAWIAGIGYGNFNMSKQGTWDVKLRYVDESENSPVISSTFITPKSQDFKAWFVAGRYALEKNLSLVGYYLFDAEKQDGTSMPDFYRAELNYKF
ncbi:S-layer homology domain-containing protein [uncultured Veillonella sp.]|uniref:S-layer homology domain-containing protein n=1 Tax=uncultured Veillonella sp. TaxID=159268 RepID=UPI00260A993C|nr:putative porin [uncultured Veillonella sp.]